MAGKRKADDNLTGTRHPAARRDPTSGYDLAGTSANTAGPTANAAGDGIAGISPDMVFLLEVTSGYGYAGGSSQFDGAARGAGGGSGYRGFSQPLSQGMLRPPQGNPAVGSAPFPYQYHAPTGNGSLSGQSQIAGPRQISDGPSSAMSCASNVLPQDPEIRYVPPRPVPIYGGATQGQGIAIGHQHQPQLDHRLRQPSSAAPAQVAVGPHTDTAGARWCRLCPAPATRVYCSAPFCEVCYSRLFVNIIGHCYL